MKPLCDNLTFTVGRRRFLAGAAGALALPFLESLAGPKLAHAWTPRPGGPSRLIFFYNGHGLIMEEFIPGANFTQGRILQPVADAGLASKLMVIGGVDQKIDDGHWGSAWSCLTCQPKHEWGTENWQIDGAGPSIDHVIGRHIRDGALPRRLDVGVHSRLDRTVTDSNLFFAGFREPVSHRLNPGEIFGDVFPSTDGPPSDEPTVDTAGLRRRSVLDGVLSQFNRLNSRVSASDRIRLESHADKLRDLERSLGDIDATPPPTSVSCEEASAPELQDPTVFRQIAEAQIDVLVHAIACNVADVGSFRMYDLGREAFSFLNGYPDIEAVWNENHHGTWHDASDRNMAPVRAAFTHINQWYGSLFARLMSGLNAFDEGEGTALDNTTIVWISEYGHGGAHNGGNLALALAGNAGGAPLGRFVNFSQNGATRSNRAEGNMSVHNLAVTLQNAFGIESNAFGDYVNVELAVPEGPLPL
ncbi:MAG: DUF1552 domain-containing protein [Myxococcota bacterium]